MCECHNLIICISWVEVFASRVKVNFLRGLGGEVIGLGGGLTQRYGHIILPKCPVVQSGKGCDVAVPGLVLSKMVLNSVMTNRKSDFLLSNRTLAHDHSWMKLNPKLCPVKKGSEQRVFEDWRRKIKVVALLPSVRQVALCELAETVAGTAGCHRPLWAPQQAQCLMLWRLRDLRLATLASTLTVYKTVA